MFTLIFPSIPFLLFFLFFLLSYMSYFTFIAIQNFFCSIILRSKFCAVSHLKDNNSFSWGFWWHLCVHRIEQDWSLFILNVCIQYVSIGVVGQIVSFYLNYDLSFFHYFGWDDPIGLKVPHRIEGDFYLFPLFRYKSNIWDDVREMEETGREGEFIIQNRMTK